MIRERLREMGLDRPLLTPAQAAAVLEVGKPAVERLVREGRVRTVRVGRRVYITAASLERLLEGGVPAAQAAWLALRLMERAGLRVELATDKGGFRASAGGKEALGVSPEEALLRLAEAVAGEEER
ncbi:helix-turn-helix domain-containing protein [Thermus sp. PS18]|uniref:helix-turn-helix domain-containing protein n=1 Tax=Thermus sp. PS18 TaxID=2849039 RepID=UPI002263B479|nr:helix-turn-helix domain-containing protein [Thermus sp. PS18]UZX15019.1 helix-turn-helix domain-containing protein [Thermus sp. PS18]